MTNKTKTIGDTRKRTINHSKHNNIDDIIELETNEYGQVITNKDLIQIKFWRLKNKVTQLVGTITFHHHESDYTFSGIVNRRNAGMIVNTWFNTGISDYVVEKINNVYFVDIFWFKYYFYKGQIQYLMEFKSEYPEYKQLKLEVR
jgi:hypothetical protein